jgi:hypothetical protein
MLWTYQKAERTRSPRIAAIWKVIMCLKPLEKTEAGAIVSNPFKNPKKGAYHTFLGPPMAKALRAAIHPLKATFLKSASTSDC